jgi:hypothetical protein
VRVKNRFFTYAEMLRGKKAVLHVDQHHLNADSQKQLEDLVIANKAFPSSRLWMTWQEA